MIRVRVHDGADRRTIRPRDALAGIVGHGASIAGSQYLDNTDYCDAAPDDAAALTDEGCILRNTTQVNEVSVVTVPSQIP